MSVPTDFPDAAKWYNYVRLRSVTAPDGEKFGLPNASHFENGNYYPEVDPRWKSVTANFELTLPNAPPGADGRFEDKYHFETPLPTRENPTLEPNQTVTTPHGTTYTLKKIATDFAQGRTTITVGVRPADVPGADAWMRSAVAIAVVDGQVNQPNLNTSGNAAEEIYDFPALASAARTLELFFTGGEIAPAWKSPDFFRALDIEVPVAALVKANPPAVTTMGALPSYFAENSRFSARLDITENNASGVQSTLWLRPEKAPGATNTAVRQVPEVTAVRALTADGTSVRIYPIERKAAVFHNDGSAPAPDETSIALELPRFGSTPAGPVQLQFDINSSAQLAREYGPRDVPIPPLGSPALAAPDSKGSVRLQRMAQVEAGSALAAQILQRTAGKIDLGAHNACLMVFDVERALPDSSFVLSDLILDGVALKSYQSGLWNGNALADQKSGAVTLILAQQAVKSAPIHFDLIEKTVGKPEPMLVLKDVEIKAPQK